MAYEKDPNPPPGTWWAQLQPASFLGIPFAVRGGQSTFGRRNAVHEYPFRDTPWAEDMGRATRGIRIIGFLVGDDAIAQRDRLVAAAETKDGGQLVHPTLGRLYVSLIELVVEESTEGRAFGLQLTFVETGNKQFPRAQASTSAAVTTQAGNSRLATAYAFALRVTAAYRQGAEVVRQVKATADFWTRQVQNVANDATNVYNAVSTLAGAAQGLYGRYFAGRTLSGLYKAPATVTLPTVDDLIARAANARLKISNALDSLSTAAQGDDPGAISTAADTVAQAVRQASVDPADALRILTNLQPFDPPVYSTTAPIGAAVNTAVDATGDLFRRSVVIALAEASLVYQPSSYDDAIDVRTRVCRALDVEITIAGDQNEDQAFSALRALRAAVSFDLASRGATLAPIKEFEANGSLPAPAWAARLYRDPSRSDQLVVQVNPRHPAFMPTKFKALAE